MDLREQIRNEVISARILAKTVDEAVDAILILSNVVEQSEQYCECEKPTLGKSVSRCGTCDEWFKPLK